jgi:hypothetical protein
MNMMVVQSRKQTPAVGVDRPRIVHSQFGADRGDPAIRQEDVDKLAIRQFGVADKDRVWRRNDP